MREGQVTNSKLPALKHLICSTFQPLGLLQEGYCAPEEGQEAETLSKLNVLKLKIWSWLLDPYAYSYLRVLFSLKPMERAKTRLLAIWIDQR